MKLANGILRPGRVLEVLDGGKIRAEVPGLFSADDKDKLPPIYPFLSSHSNSYSHPKEYDEVWILSFSDNPLQLHWFRKDNISENDKNILSEENVEILCNRETGMDWATIYFSDGSGWIISKGDSKIQINKEGNILLYTPNPHRIIDINDKCISIGSEGESAHPAAKGDNVVDILNDICGLFGAIQKVSLANPYTALIGTTITPKLLKIRNKIGSISSQHVKID